MRRNHALDGLRGYSALAVCVYHAVLAFRPEELVPSFLAAPVWAVDGNADRFIRAFLLLANGETAVELFFTLSGAVLLSSLCGATRPALMQIPIFAVKRLLRIFPALLACITTTFVVSALASKFLAAHVSGYTWVQFLENALLLDTPINGATWTLKVEILAIPFILGTYLLRRTIGPAASFIALAYGIAAIESRFLGIGVWLAPEWLVWFATGFVAYELRSSELVAEITSGWRWVIPLFVLLFARGFTSIEARTGIVLQAMAALLLIASLFGTNATNLSNFLNRPFAQFSGRVSYSFYLWNVPVMGAVAWALKAKGVAPALGPFATALICAALTIFVSFPIAAVSYRLFEVPLMKGLPRFMRRQPHHGDPEASVVTTTS